MQLLENGQVDLGTIQGDIPASDSNAGVTTLYQDACHLIASGESGIETFADLPGHPGR